MAAADYWLCDRCGRKTFYDANLDYNNSDRLRSDGRMLPSGAGDAQVICVQCAEANELVIRPKAATETKGEPT
jgi:hypothetical protein